MEPAPEPFLHALRLTLNLPPEASIPHHLSSHEQKWVILLDSYEVLSPLGLAADLFPTRTSRNCFNSASRALSTGPDWRADPGWHSFASDDSPSQPQPDEGREYLERCGIEGAFNFTHSHLLALSLITDLYSQRGIEGSH